MIALVTVGVSRLEPAAPRVDRDTIYLDTVQRGPMVRQVRGTGTLVPEQIRWIPATTDGTVERIVIRPGALVAPDTVILEMSNPELAQSALEARLNLEAAEARYSNRQVEVERELVNQRADACHHGSATEDRPPAGGRRRAALHAGPRRVVATAAVAVRRAGVRDALRAQAGTAADGHRCGRGAACDSIRDRIAAAPASRELAEEQLQAEESKFEVGLSTNVFILQSQRDLATAQDAELRAIPDYQRTRIEFERTQRASLGGAGVALVGSATGASVAGPTGAAPVGADADAAALNRAGTGTRRPKGDAR